VLQEKQGILDISQRSPAKLLNTLNCSDEDARGTSPEDSAKSLREREKQQRGSRIASRFLHHQESEFETF
jgi:hypothetical protein